MQWEKLALTPFFLSSHWKPEALPIALKLKLAVPFDESIFAFVIFVFGGLPILNVRWAGFGSGPPELTARTRNV